MGGFLQTIGRLLAGGRRPDPRMVRTPPFLPGPDNDPANVSGWGPERLDQITGRALDAQWRGAPILQPPSITTPSFIPGDQNLEAVSQPQERRPTLIPPQASGPVVPPRNEVPRQPLSPPQDITSPPPRTQGLVDLNPQVLQDRANDYSGQRRTIRELPRQGDYAPGKARTALSMITGLAGDVAASNPFSWVGRAAAPTIQQASGKILDRGYNRAMQAHKEKSQVAEGLAGTSQNELKLEDQLATGQAGRDYKDLVAENAKLRTANDKAKLEQNMQELTLPQAQMMGLEEEYQAAQAIGQPLKMHRRLIQAEIDRAKANEVQQLKSDAYVKVKTEHDAVWKEIEKERNTVRQEIAKLTTESKERVAEGQNASRERATGIRASASRANTQDIVKSREQFEKNKFRAEQLKQNMLSKITAQRDRELNAAQMLLGKDAQGNPRTPQQVLAAAANGDTTAARAYADYQERKEQAYKEAEHNAEQLNQAYRGMVGSGDDEDQAPAATPSRQTPAPARKPTSPAPTRRPLNQIIQVK